jgi:hypothetical protein
LFLNGNGSYRSYNFYVKDISFSPLNHESFNNINNDKDEFVENKNYNNISSSKNNSNLTTLVKGLKLYGPYNVTIMSKGLLDLPSSALSSSPSQYDYIAISIPVEFDMILKLSNGARAEFTMIREGSELENDHNNLNSISINNKTGNNNNQIISRITNGMIYFHGMKTSDFPRITSVAALVKSPLIQVNGNASFETIYLLADANKARAFARASPAEIVNGKLITKFDHVDHYIEPYRNGTSTQYVTYLKWINTNGIANAFQEKLQTKLPADIATGAKERGIEVPWQKAIVSANSIIALVSISLVSIIVTCRMWPKVNKRVHDHSAVD